MAEELGVENASTLRTQDLIFAILKQLSKNAFNIRSVWSLDLEVSMTCVVPSALNPAKRTADLT